MGINCFPVVQEDVEREQRLHKELQNTIGFVDLRAFDATKYHWQDLFERATGCDVSYHGYPFDTDLPEVFDQWLVHYNDNVVFTVDDSQELQVNMNKIKKWLEICKKHGATVSIG